jgi:hypothetical protein
LIALIIDAHPSAEGFCTNDRSRVQTGSTHSEKRPACFANHPRMWVSLDEAVNGARAPIDRLRR